MTMKLYRVCMPAVLLAMSLGASSAQALAGNAERGGDVFDGQCAECHSVKPGKNKKGPSLFASIGRKAASVPEFIYSDGLKQSGIVWTPEKIEAYLAAPKTVVPGGKMKFDTKLTQQEAADLLAFLATLH
jgi:cytochrome c